MTRLHRKNFLPTVITNLVLWVICGLIVCLTSPETTLHIVIFLIFFSLALFITLALLFANSRRGFLVTFFVANLALTRFIKIQNLFLSVSFVLLPLILEAAISIKKKVWN